MSCPTILRRQYIIADTVIARGALQFPYTSGPVPL